MAFSSVQAVKAHWLAWLGGVTVRGVGAKVVCPALQRGEEIQEFEQVSRRDDGSYRSSGERKWQVKHLE